MRNATIRKKRLREQRLLDEFLRRPRRIMMGAQEPTITEWANMPGRLWAISDGSGM